jgi:hypothetical protein
MAGVKHDQGKPRYDLLPFRALDDVARVMDFGAAKYGANNWRGGMRWGRYLAAAMRHLAAWARGEADDRESGLPHLAHAAACCLILLELVHTGAGDDDRPSEHHVNDVDTSDATCRCSGQTLTHQPSYDWRP